MTKDVLPPAVRQALERGNPIEAIKLLRKELPKAARVLPTPANSSLRPRKGLSPGQVDEGGGAGKWLALIAVAAAVIAAALYA